MSNGDSVLQAAAQELIGRVFTSFYPEVVNGVEVVVLSYMCRRCRVWTSVCQMRTDLYYLSDASIDASLKFLLRTNLIGQQPLPVPCSCGVRCLQYKVTLEAFVDCCAHRAHVLLRSFSGHGHGHHRAVSSMYGCTSRECQASYAASDLCRLMDPATCQLRCSKCSGPVRPRQPPPQPPQPEHQEQQEQQAALEAVAGLCAKLKGAQRCLCKINLVL